MNVTHFQIDDERSGEVRILSVKGELDLDTAPRLQEPLERALSEAGSRIVIDLTDCEFMDSTGVALIVRSWQRHDRDAENGGGDGRLVLCCPSDQVKRLLEITGVGASIPTHEDREGAVADALE